MPDQNPVSLEDVNALVDLAVAKLKQDQKPTISWSDAEALAALAVPALATYPLLAEPNQEKKQSPPRSASPPRPPVPGPFAWRVDVPPTRDRVGKVIGVTAPFLVRGLTRHEAAEAVRRRTLGGKVPRGTQITASVAGSALIDLRSPRPEFSIRFI